MIDHADKAFSEKYFHLVSEKGEQGILPMLNVATLEDRILMKSSKPQKYGTQAITVLLRFTKDSGETEEEIVSYIWPIEDNEKVEELRAAVGLPPMEHQIQASEGSRLKVIWDKNLTIDDLKEKYPWFFQK